MFQSKSINFLMFECFKVKESILCITNTYPSQSIYLHFDRPCVLYYTTHGISAAEEDVEIQFVIPLVTFTSFAHFQSLIEMKVQVDKYILCYILFINVTCSSSMRSSENSKIILPLQLIDSNFFDSIVKVFF